MIKQIKYHKKEYALPKKYNGKKFICVFKNRVTIGMYCEIQDRFIEENGNEINFDFVTYWGYLNTPE